MPTYTIRRTELQPELAGLWDGPVWSPVPALDVALFHAKSSDHHPVTRAKLLYDHEALYVHFRVEDQHVLSVNTQYQSSVCRDSCVEFFVETKPGTGYFNFEINAGGTILLYHMVPVREPVKAYNDSKAVQVAHEHLDQIQIFHSLPNVVRPERHGPLTWSIEYRVPFSLFEAYVPGATPVKAGTAWRANFYKCADQTSKPHWASWAPIDPALAFHRPDYFAPIIFGT